MEWTSNGPRSNLESGLVPGGRSPYIYTRNPGYLALTLVYLALGFLFSSVWVGVLLAPTLLVLNVSIVRKEEEHLERQFGGQYLAYKVRVRRWL